MHLVICIDGDKTPYERRHHLKYTREKLHVNHDNFPAERQNIASLQSIVSPQYIENMAGWLSIAIRCIKRAVTAYARTNQIAFQWQPRFYDRIMRDMDEMSNTIDYVLNNVASWDIDNENDIDIP